jgi:hypothetical protein
MSKYEPLKRFLSSQTGVELPLTFKDVEQTLGFALPQSARRHPPWWANETEGGHVQARSWIEAGWKASQVDVAGERVVFVRASPGTPGHKAPATESDRVSVSIDLGALPLAAARLLREFATEAGGDFSKAVARVLQEAVIARRVRLLERFPLSAERSPGNSVDLVREDRDAR